jgi:hypothetical protein
VDRELQQIQQKWELSRNGPFPNSNTAQKFLGLTGYYGRSIQDYGLICKPFHDLLKKDSFVLTPNHTLALHNLQKKMSTAPVLALPDFTKPFVPKIDATRESIGLVLMQQGRATAFFSQALGPKALAQCTYHKEALAILEALKKWRHISNHNRSTESEIYYVTKAK